MLSGCISKYICQEVWWTKYVDWETLSFVVDKKRKPKLWFLQLLHSWFIFHCSEIYFSRLDRQTTSDIWKWGTFDKYLQTRKLEKYISLRLKINQELSNWGNQNISFLFLSTTKLHLQSFNGSQSTYPFNILLGKHIYKYIFVEMFWKVFFKGPQSTYCGLKYFMYSTSSLQIFANYLFVGSYPDNILL